MSGPTDTVKQLAEAINRGDLEKALALYEPEAVLVREPGRLARGRDELRAALADIIQLKPTLQLETEQVVEMGDLALYLSRWNLRGTDPAGQPITLEGESSDILRRQRDGRWLIAIDNPWGTEILAQHG